MQAAKTAGSCRFTPMVFTVKGSLSVQPSTTFDTAIDDGTAFYDALHAALHAPLAGALQLPPARLDLRCVS